MEKKNLPVIAAAVVVGLALIGGIFLLSSGDGSMPNQPPGTPTVKPTGESAEYFQQRMIAIGVQKIGQPIEGFDSELLIMAFPGLLHSDFHLVATFEGHYEMRSGKLEFIRDQQNMISSAERTVSDAGYATLLANVATRLGMPAATHMEIDAIISTLSQGGTGKSEAIETRLNRAGSAMGVRITPLEVLEDSRCPVDVTCIWAGTVRLRATLSVDGQTSEQTFTLGQAVMADGASIMLEHVEPEANSKVEMKPSDYRFFFTISKP